MELPTKRRTYHEESPPDDYAVDRDTQTLAGKGCAKGTDDDDDL